MLCEEEEILDDLVEFIAFEEALLFVLAFEEAEVVLVAS